MRTQRRPSPFRRPLPFGERGSIRLGSYDVPQGIGLSGRTAETKRMDDLFGASNAEEIGIDPDAPLAARMRPRSLDEYQGQPHILGPGKLLRRAIESDRLTSIIFYGPPGSGKTSLAQIIASTTKSHFERLSGVESSVADIRRVAASAGIPASIKRRTNDPLYR